MTAAGIQSTTLWRAVPVGPLSEALDVVGPSSSLPLIKLLTRSPSQICDQYPWLKDYENDWPTTSAVKQFLRNARNNLRHKSRKAAAHAAPTPAITTTID